MIKRIPLLIFALIGYNALVFMPSKALEYIPTVALDAQLFSLQMVSKSLWTFTIADALISFALFLLFIELIKATRTDMSSIIDHGLSTLVFIICLVEFIIVDKAANSTFFLITLVTLIDVIAGYSITIMTARRDLTVGPSPE